MRADSSVTTAGQRGLSGYCLKMIAVVTMFVDHTAATILLRMLEQMPSWGPISADNYAIWRRVYLFMRGIGRMAFPIYCYLLVEGFTHTRNRAKYALRLFVFALLSEVPFDMAFQKSFFDLSYNNVFLTLLIGLLTIWGIHEVRNYGRTDKTSEQFSFIEEILRGLFMIVITFAGCVAAELLHTDYGASGIIAIFILYLFYERRLQGFGLMVLSLGLLAGELEFVAFLMLIPMSYYNGTRGKQNKYFFYAFYPIHLLVLSLICLALGLGV